MPDTTPVPIGADALRVAAQAALTALENLHEIDTETECITIDVRDEIDALRAALVSAAQPVAVLPGYVLVPVEPTAAMLQAILSEGEADAALDCPPEVRGLLIERAGVPQRYAAMLAAAPNAVPAQCPTSVDAKTMELAESVGLIGPASRTHDLHAAIQRFHDLVCVNATIKAAQMASDAIREVALAAQGDALDQGVREELSIGKAINRAARDLPEGWEIRIDLERHAGVVFLIDPDGNETMSEGGELFSDQINAAIDAPRGAQGESNG